MKTYQIIVDKREKRPLPFPAHLVMLDPQYPAVEARSMTVRLTTVRETIPTADYLVAEVPELEPGVSVLSKTVVVETKRSLEELYGNLFTHHGRQRFVAMLTRMQVFRQRVLILDGGIEVLIPSPSVKVNPGLVADALHRLCFEHGVTLIPLAGRTIDQRRRTAEYVARLLINATLCCYVPAT